MVFWRETGTNEDDEEVEVLDIGGMIAAAAMKLVAGGIGRPKQQALSGRVSECAGSKGCVQVRMQSKTNSGPAIYIGRRVGRAWMVDGLRRTARPAGVDVDRISATVANGSLSAGADDMHQERYQSQCRGWSPEGMCVWVRLGSGLINFRCAVGGVLAGARQFGNEAINNPVRQRPWELGGEGAEWSPAEPASQEQQLTGAGEMNRRERIMTIIIECFEDEPGGGTVVNVEIPVVVLG